MLLECPDELEEFHGSVFCNAGSLFRVLLPLDTDCIVSLCMVAYVAVVC